MTPITAPGRENYFAPTFPCCAGRHPQPVHRPFEKHLSLVLLNARSLCNKLTVLHAYVDYYRPDILAITETWGRPSLTDSLITPFGYVLFRRDRLGRVGGGVLLLIKKALKASSFALHDSVDTFQDSIWCSIQLSSSQSLLVGCIYRPPNCSLANDARLTSLLNFVCDTNFNHLLIAGDFNYPNIDWKKMKGCNLSDPFISCVQDNFLHQIVTSPTRQDNVLDLVFVNDPVFVSGEEVLESFPGSDHLAVRVLLKFDLRNFFKTKELPSDSPAEFNFRKADWPRFRALLAIGRDDLLRIIGMDVASQEEIDTIWTKLKYFILDAAHLSIPLRSHSRSINGVPMIGEVRAAFNNRRRIFRSLQGSTSPLAAELRDKAVNNLQEAISKSQAAYEREIVTDSRSNPKRFWCHMRKTFSSKTTASHVIDSSGGQTTDEWGTAQAFNNYFISVFRDEDNLHLPSVNPKTSVNFSDFPISHESVSSAIRRLRSLSSPGPDGISNMLIKEGGHDLTSVIVEFFRLTLRMGRAPAEWKVANVIPIYKKGSRLECSNYRPISLTCCLCRLFKRLLKNALLQHVLCNNLVSDSQHGFLPLRSCTSALTSYLEQITSSIDNKQCVDSISLDFAKAFDTVPHRRLILKLQNYGVAGNVLSWIQSFLLNRYQRVVVGKTFSDLRPILSGVPQGSVIGPLLFVLFIDDIDQELESKVIKFADDVKIFSPVSSTYLEADLRRISKWCSTWLLNLNVGKCSCMHFGLNNDKRQYQNNGILIPSATSLIDLGIVITDDLKPSEQCLRAASRANRLVSTIKLAFKHLDMHSWTLIYKAFVRPVLEYCCTVWSPYYIKDIELLEKVQRRFTRISPSCRHLPYEERLKAHNIPSLYARRLYLDLLTVYKYVHRLIHCSPACTYFDFLKNSRTRGHNFRIRPLHCNTNLRRYWFTNRIVPIWNALPVSCVEAESPKRFKKEIWSYFTLVGIH